MIIPYYSEIENTYLNKEHKILLAIIFVIIKNQFLLVLF